MAAPRLGIIVDYSAPFAEAVPEVVEAERIGAEVVTTTEAYSVDSVSRLGYLAAATSRMALAAGILPLFSRTPSLLAMTAAGLDEVSGGRFELGLGASGAQVIEGFHGVPYERPLAKMRETVNICRVVWRREPVVNTGREYPLPLPADRGRGLGKPLKLINRPPRARIPISIAALAPKGVAQAAEIAEGWLPLFYWPERADAAWGASLDAGLARREPALGPLRVSVQAPLLIGESTEEALVHHRGMLALYVGGMGAPGANFYNDLAVAYGYADQAALAQELYLSGRKEEAAAALPEELVRATALVGTEAEVRARVRAYADRGVHTLTVQPVGTTPAARLEQLEAMRGLLDALPADG
ncbi:MAG: LLM class F420-dependent oxidoreductase [Micrococcales bacterium]|nr:LLM class F420-dependent oxidoreductase [Micrococcales bacterium]